MTVDSDIFVLVDALPGWPRVRSRVRELFGPDALPGQSFAQGFSETAVPMALLGPTGEVLALNPALTCFFPEARLPGPSDRPADFTHPDDIAETVEVFDRLRKGEREEYTLKKRYVLGGDKVIWAEVRVLALREGAGLACALAVLRDAAAGTSGPACALSGRQRTEKTRSAVQLIADALITCTDPRDFMARVHAIIGNIMPADNFFIALQDEASGLLRFPYHVDEHDEPPESLPPGQGLTGYVLSTGRPLLADKARLIEMQAAGEIRVKGTMPGSWLGVPLVIGTAARGVAAVQSYRDEAAYDEADCRILEMVSVHVAGAVQRLRAEAALRESEEKFRDLFEKHSAVMLLVDPQSLQVVDANLAAAAFYGHSRKKLSTMRVDEINLLSRETLLEKARASMQGLRVHRFSHRLASGEVREVEVHSSPVSMGERRVLFSIVHDVTESALARKELAESELRFRKMFENAGIGIAILDLDGHVVDINPRGAELTGYSYTELTTMSFTDYNPSEDAALTKELFRELVCGKREVFSLSKRYRRKDGAIIWGKQTVTLVRGENGEPRYAISMLEDITSQKLAEEKLTHMAFHDELTGLANRALFLDRLESAIKRARRRPDYRFAVLFLDLDRFKVVNDSLGHTMGDALLAAIAERVAGTLRETDTLARFGGDEFAVLLDDVGDVFHATHIIERLQQSFAEPFLLEDNELFASASIGVILSTANYDNPETLLRDADIAMYRAKGAGPGRYEIFDRSMREQAMALHRLETDLRGAVDRDEFTLSYQPVIRLESGGVESVEALLRWNHPKKGGIRPLQFIPVAEESGLIREITAMVLAKAAHGLNDWTARLPGCASLAMRINLSASCFGDEAFLGRFTAALDALPVAPHRLVLEITEHLLMSRESRILDRMLALKERGVRFSIDDFGTGWSSLSYLQRYPIDEIKIDKSFVQGIVRRPSEKAIVRSCLDLARNLGLDVVAEGVETEAQAAALASLGCTRIQGYLHGKPMAEGEWLGYLEARGCHLDTKD